MSKKYKYLPRYYYDSFKDIPYDDLILKKKIKVVFLDLDNTLLSPKEKQLTFENQIFLNEIQKKVKVIILSNASSYKLKKVLKNKYNYIHLKWYQKKPFCRGFRKALNQIDARQALMIGDQLSTDIAGANKMDIISILVKPLDRKNESFWTKIKRFLLERPFIKKIKKKDYQNYKEKFKNFIK